MLSNSKMQSPGLWAKLSRKIHLHKAEEASLSKFIGERAKRVHSDTAEKKRVGANNEDKISTLPAELIDLTFAKLDVQALSVMRCVNRRLNRHATDILVKKFAPKIVVNAIQNLSPITGIPKTDSGAWFSTTFGSACGMAVSDLEFGTVRLRELPESYAKKRPYSKSRTEARRYSRQYTKLDLSSSHAAFNNLVNLRKLGIRSSSRISAREIQSLVSSPQLRFLYIHQETTSDRILSKISALESLEVLVLEKTGIEDFENIFKKCKGLQMVALSHVRGISPAALNNIGLLPNLKMLELASLDFSDGKLQWLKPSKNITHLHLSANAILESALQIVADMRDLVQFVASDVPLTSQTLKIFTGHKRLEVMSVPRCITDDKTFSAFRKTPRLRLIEISRPGLTQSTYNTLWPKGPDVQKYNTHYNWIDLENQIRINTIGGLTQFSHGGGGYGVAQIYPEEWDRLV
jgi:hypothetical protein